MPVAYDPMLPRVSLMTRGGASSDGSFESVEPYREQADSSWYAADERSTRRAFRRGYRHAARAALTDANACAELASWPEEDGCLAYVSEAGQRDEAYDTYDP